jgi:hypothetical protein
MKKYIITESQNKFLKRIRRIGELRDIIQFQVQIQDPCNFSDGDEYAHFCINEGMRFFFGDEDYERDDDVFSDEERNEGREEIEKLMFDDYYDDFVELWNEISDDC